MELYNSLAYIQQELKVPKSERNTFANFDYRSAEKILEAVKPLVHGKDLTLLLSDEVVNIGDANYVKATVTLTNGKERISVDAYAREEVAKKGMDTAQITGSTSSYARKYALSGLFAIDDTKDPDSQDNTTHASTAPRKTASSTNKATDKQRALIAKKLAENGVPTSEMAGVLIEQYGITDTANMTAADASIVIEDLIGVN